MSQLHRVIALSVGLHRGGRLATAALGVVVLGASAYVLVAALNAPSAEGVMLFTGQSAPPGSPEGTDLLAGGVGDLVRLTGLCTVPVVLAVVLLVVRVLRQAAWLDGSRVVVRGLRTRSADLSRADVSVGIRGAGGAPTLDARDPVTGASVRVPLRRLPATELAALASAVGRDTPAAERLRALAADPLV